MKENFFPNIPNLANNNLAQGAFQRLAGFVDEVDADYRVINEMAWGLCHPQSIYFGDQTLTQSLLTSIQKKIDILGELNEDGSGTWFEKSYEIFEAYAMLKATFPERISSTQQTNWENAMNSHVTWILGGPGNKFINAPPLVSLNNHDVCWMMSVAYASYLFNEPSYKEIADSAVSMFAKSFLPDGGFAYVGEHNETFTYHHINIMKLARYWQISGNETALDLVKGSWWYYPLSIEPGGTAEYYTAASWKQYWNQVNGADAAYIVAALTGSGENLTVAQWNNQSSHLFMASFFRDDLNAIASPDNYFVYDANIMGPRGRFGLFSFAGTGSPYTTNRRGKQTLVGCMVTNSNDNHWDLNAALGDVYTAVRVDTGDIGYDVRTDKAHILSNNEQNASTVSVDFSALTTRYELSNYWSWDLEPWEGTQQWIYTSKRMVGLVSLESLENQAAYGMQVRYKFISGRASWGTRKTFDVTGSNSYTYGKLNVIFHDMSFGGHYTRYTETYSGDTEKSGEIILRDPQSHSNNEGGPVNFIQNQKYFVLAEIYPNTSSPASSLTRLDLPGGLVGLELEEEGRHLRLIHNPTKGELSYTSNLGWVNGATLHRSGEKYRPHWMNTYTGHRFSEPRVDNSINHIPTALSPGAINISIAPHEHIILVGHSINTPVKKLERFSEPNKFNDEKKYDLLGRKQLSNQGILDWWLLQK